MTYQLRLWEEGQWGIKSKLIQNKNKKSWCSGMSKASNVLISKFKILAEFYGNLRRKNV